MNQKLSFETIPFEYAPEFQGELFEEESERGGSRRSPRSKSGSRSPYAAGQRPGRSPTFSPARPKKPPVRKPSPSGSRPRGPWGIIREPYGLVSEPFSGEPEPSGSERVRWVQDSLNRILGLRLPVTGVMGPETRSAVRSFQKQKGLPVSGIVGPDTEKALLDARHPADAAAPPDEPAQDQGEVYEFETLELESPQSMPTLRRGSRGPAVADLQRRLAAAGFSPGTADGDFGSLTDAAVKSFQRSRGITADGIVGSQTWGQLYAQPGAGGATPSPSSPTAPPRPACTVVWPAVMLTTLRSNIVITAVGERLRWQNGALKEWDDSARSILVDYWLNGVGMTPSDAARFADQLYAWSAAFICWVLRKAGAGKDFSYNSYHSTYIAASYQNRMSGNCSPFKAYRLNEAAPQLGDLVCTTYQNVPVDLERVRPGTSGYHCDIVVKIEPGKLTTLGGNVSDSVGQRTVTIDANGFVNKPGYFAVIKVG